MAAVLLCTVQAAAQSKADAYMGVPFFRNYSAGQYDAHNRNFDVLCDEEGHTFFANFEGLLVYDQVHWRIVHTPDISRVVRLHKDADGAILFDGINLTGRVESFEGDSIRVSFTPLAGKESAIETSVDRWNEIEVYQRLKISDNRILLATATDGVIAVNAQGQEIWRINVEDGLCSNSITKLAYDGKGTVWGATDNGVFSISVSEIYTRFTEKEGFRGQISCIEMCGPTLMVGTFQGLFHLEGQRFRPVAQINHACWHLVQGANGILYVATSDGLYEYNNGKVRQLTTKFSLSLAALGDGSFLVGELERVCRFRPGEEIKVIGEIPNITSFKKDEKGGMWALTLAGDYYYMEAGGNRFQKKDQGPISKLFEYVDNAGNVWHGNSDGTGLFYNDMPEELEEWVEPFAQLKVNAMLVHGGLAWIGDNEELIRFNLDQCTSAQLFTPQLHIRRFNFNDGGLALSFANDKLDPLGETLYSYRLHNDNAWSAWSPQQEFLFADINFGSYQVEVRSRDAFGQISQSIPYEFKRPYPFFVRWYSLLFYLFVILGLVYLWFQHRMRRMAQEQQRLEAIVDERTKELRSAQDQLLRQEREAAIGKLTKGLIDRILNPMNYINNFAHLTLGLNKDMRQNIEDEKEHISNDIYEDSQDIMDMMQTNLEKIEQHGTSTTRTLKAMEEMLKERSQKFEPTDLVQLSQQCVDKLKAYYASDINALGIQVETNLPATPLMRDVVADQVGKSLMSMLANSVYAIKKKAEKGGAPYSPVIRLSVLEEDGKAVIKIYDNGIGIEESILNKIFDPFFTTKPTAEAPGVGLYLSQQIMHDCGGNITVNSSKDDYTEFVISLT
jgi:signal transduction histidine kinase